MKIIVVKFGGTSVANEEARASAIERIKEYKAQGYSVVSVVSAMGRKGAPYATDTLLSLVSDDAAPEIRDLIMTCGESISACVFADSLCKEGIDAVAMNGMTAGIKTDGTPLSAEIIGMDTGNVIKELENGRTVVITGFQGVSQDGKFNTLGRGGSDTSAAAISGYLKAEACVIFTDVPGVAECDPRVVPQARFMDNVEGEDMLLLAEKGAGVIHPRAVRTALELDTPLKVASTFQKDGGTIIAKGEKKPGFVGLALAKSDGKSSVSMVYHPADDIMDKVKSMFSENQIAREGDLITLTFDGEEDNKKAALELYGAFAV